ncbi:galactose-3-O-sulfotransferase 2-like [Watersipora subatra]|uniref:galactose-3-O-sulfotransferase 2-like n=1 Tax=Watersipora subatra TaxID=2589382 RepID=UPI00355BE9B1
MMRHHCSNRCFFKFLLVTVVGSMVILLSRVYLRSPLDFENGLYEFISVSNQSTIKAQRVATQQQEMLREITKSTSLRPMPSHINDKSAAQPTSISKGNVREEKTLNRTNMNSSYPNTTLSESTSTTTFVPLVEPPDCVGEFPVRCFVLTKIEKTGSSTLFAIFARYVRSHRLNILMQTKFVHIDWRRPKGRAWDIGPGRVTRADVLINHARYNKSMIDQYVRKGYKYVVIAREPVSWFKSAAKYYDFLFGKQTPQQILYNNRTLYAPRSEASGIATWFHLHQLQWLGFNYHRDKDNMTAIRQHIDWVVPKIDVVMLNEQYDASLIILRRRFGWSYTDIFYSKYIITNSKVTQLSVNATKKLLSPEVNLGEKILYDRLNETWWSQSELEEDNFWEEVDHFSSLNSDVSARLCQQVFSSKREVTISSSQWHEALNLTFDTCHNLLKLKYIPMMEDLGSYALGNRYKYHERFS